MSRDGLRTGWVVAIMAAVGLALVTAGCEPGDKAPSGGEESTASLTSPTVQAALAKADQADGTADKVIAKCIGCGLAMEGKAEFASTVGAYKAHLCSKDCKDAFDKDPAKALLALKVEAPATEGSTPKSAPEGSTETPVKK